MQTDSLLLVLALFGAFAAGFVLGLSFNALRRMLRGVWRAPGNMARGISRVGSKLRDSLRPPARPERDELGEIPLPEGRLSRAVASVLTFPLQRAQALFAMAESAFEAGEYRAAEGHYRAALLWDYGRALHPLYIRANLRLGQIRLQRGDLDGAVEAYESVRDADPANVEAYLQLGTLYFRQGRPGQALYELGRALELEPTNLEVRYRLFQVYEQSGMEEEARSQLRMLKAGEKPEVIVELFMRHGREHLRRQAWEMAGTDYHLVLELMPEREEAIWALGDILRRQGELQQALQVWARGLLVAPSPALEQRLLHLARQDGFWDQVTLVYQRALLLYPRRGAFYLALGDMARERQMMSEAAGYWERAVAVEPDLLEAHLRLEDYYEQSGRSDQARGHLRAALRLLRNREVVYRCRVCGHTTPLEQPYCFVCSTWDSLQPITRQELQARSALVPAGLADGRPIVQRLESWWQRIRGFLLSAPEEES